MKIYAVDIGGTSIKSGWVEDGQVAQTEETETPARAGGEAVMAAVASILEAHPGFVRIGVSTAGQVDSRTGTIRFANENIPHYTGMRVKERLEKRFGVPVAVENDVNSAAIGEAHYGAGLGCKNFLCLTYGTGVGGAIFIDGRLYPGSSDSAGEFGHLITHGGGELCGCGGRGCYERYASASALVRRAMRLDASLNSGRVIFQHMEDHAVRRIVDDWIQEIVIGLVSLVHIFNPERVLLGGGIMSQPYILDSVRRYLYDRVMPSYRNVEIYQAQLHNSAGLLGAAWLAAQLPG